MSEDRALSSETATLAESVADWNVLELPGVDEAARNAAARVARSWGGVTTADDQYQEALLLLALNPERVGRLHGEGGPAFVSQWVWGRLMDRLRPDMRRSQREVSLEALRREAE